MSMNVPFMIKKVNTIVINFLKKRIPLFLLRSCESYCFGYCNYLLTKFKPFDEKISTKTFKSQRTSSYVNIIQTLKGTEVQRFDSLNVTSEVKKDLYTSSS